MTLTWYIEYILSELRLHDNWVNSVQKGHSNWGFLILTCFGNPTEVNYGNI